MFLALWLKKKGLFFDDCFVLNEKVRFSSSSLVCPHKLRLAIRWTYCFSALMGAFPQFSLHFRCSCLLLHDFQTSDDLYPAERDPSSRQPLRFEFLSPFSLRCLWLSPFEEILWRVCLYSIVATWAFKSSIAFSASKSFCELLLNPIWVLTLLALLASSQLSCLR